MPGGAHLHGRAGRNPTSHPEDLTAKALRLSERHASAVILARRGRSGGGAGGIAFLLRASGLACGIQEAGRRSDCARRRAAARRRATSRSCSALERVGLNLLQRMSGIATATRCLQERLRRKSPSTRIVGTRKTPWGLLDKRALHLGNGGTHRLGLGDAIVIKNNHLALLAEPRRGSGAAGDREGLEVSRGIGVHRSRSARARPAARAAAATFRRLREDAGRGVSVPADARQHEAGAESPRFSRCFAAKNLWDDTLIEASGGISESNVEAYAACGVDAISIGALTHSARALDICQRIS